MLLDIRKISHQKQISEFSCVPACLSMVTGVSQEIIINEMERDGHKMPFPNESAVRFLCREHVHMENISGSTQMALMIGRVYLLACPSSVSEKSAHMIVGLANEHGLQILDPADDLTSEKIYSSHDFTNGNIPVFNYSLLTDCSFGA